MFSRNEIKDFLESPKTVGHYDFKKKDRKSEKEIKFTKVRGKRISHTGLLDLGGDFRLLLLVRDGDIREKRAFYAYFVKQVGSDFLPIGRLDYHCSHKELHVHFNCEIYDRDFTNRALPGVKSLNLKGKSGLDPAQERDRESLVNSAFQLFGVKIEKPQGSLL